MGGAWKLYFNTLKGVGGLGYEVEFHCCYSPSLSFSILFSDWSFFASQHVVQSSGARVKQRRSRLRSNRLSSRPYLLTSRKAKIHNKTYI